MNVGFVFSCDRAPIPQIICIGERDDVLLLASTEGEFLWYPAAAFTRVGVADVKLVTKLVASYNETHDPSEALPAPYRRSLPTASIAGDYRKAIALAIQYADGPHETEANVLSKQFLKLDEALLVALADAVNSWRAVSDNIKTAPSTTPETVRAEVSKNLGYALRQLNDFSRN